MTELRVTANLLSSSWPSVAISTTCNSRHIVNRKKVAVMTDRYSYRCLSATTNILVNLKFSNGIAVGKDRQKDDARKEKKKGILL